MDKNYYPHHPIISMNVLQPTVDYSKPPPPFTSVSSTAAAVASSSSANGRPKDSRSSNNEVVYVYDESEMTKTQHHSDTVYVYDAVEYNDERESRRVAREAEDKQQRRTSRRSRSTSRNRRRRSRTDSKSASRSRSRSRSRGRHHRHHHRRTRRSHSSRSRSRTPPRRRRRSSRSHSSSEERERHFRYQRYHADPHHTIAIKGLPAECDENVIYGLMQQQGFQPKDIRILRKKDTGQSRGFGFIEMIDTESAKAWMEYTKGYLEVDSRHRAELQYSIDKVGWSMQQTATTGLVQKFGDWMCAKCTMNNFKKRDECFKCGLPRAESDVLQERGFSAIGVLPCDTLLFRELPDRCDDHKISESLRKVSALEPICISMSQSKMFAYVQMRSVAESTQLLTALTQMTSLKIDGCEILVSYSKLPLAAILTGQTLTQTADQLNRMQQRTQQSMPSQTDSANVAAAVAQNAMRKAQVMRQVTNEMLSGQIEAMQAAQLAVAGLVVPSQHLIMQTQQRLIAAATLQQHHQPPTEIRPSIKLGTVMTPFGELPRYPVPNTSLYQYEPKSGYYFDPTTGLYYDGNQSRYYYNSQSQQWLYWDGNFQTFLPCPSQSTASNKSSDSAATDVQATSNPTTVVGNEKDSKVKSAKKIQKEMERWAREQEKLKTTVKQTSDQSVVNTIQQSSTSRSSSDAAFAILEKTKTAAAGGGGGSLLHLDDQMNDAEQVVVNDYDDDDGDDDDEQSHVDLTKMACLLCRRQFPSLDILNKHVQLSDLHKQNLAIRRKQTIDSAVDDEDESAPGCSTAGGTTTQIQYRDRAKERRKKYGHDKVLSGFETTGHDLLKQRYISSVQEKESEESLKTPISEGNIGSKLLKSMGWSEGQGLGRNNQGIVDPILAERRVQGAGLGAIGSKVKVGTNATYKESVKAALRDRYFEIP